MSTAGSPAVTKIFIPLLQPLWSTLLESYQFIGRSILLVTILSIYQYWHLVKSKEETGETPFNHVMSADCAQFVHQMALSSFPVWIATNAAFSWLARIINRLWFCIWCCCLGVALIEWIEWWMKRVNEHLLDQFHLKTKWWFNKLLYYIDCHETQSK